MGGPLYQSLLVGIGGFVGSVLRFAISGLVQRADPAGSFPYGTLAVNGAGCLAIGVLAGLADTRQVLSPDLRLLLLIGRRLHHLLHFQLRDPRAAARRRAPEGQRECVRLRGPVPRLGLAGLRRGERAMMQPGEGQLLRIFIGENDRYEKLPLYEWIVRQARERNMAGATVLRGLEGFGAKSHLHTARILRLSSDLPVVVEIVDTREKIEGFLPVIDEAIADGLATLEKVEIRFYRNGQQGDTP